MRKKRVKTKAEISAEEFFPVEPTDVKQTIEKPVKYIDRASLTTIEKPGIFTNPSAKPKKVRKPKAAKEKKTIKKNKSKSLKLTKSSKTISYEPAKNQLKTGGYELVITEKPQAAAKIAAALGKAASRNLLGVPFYEINRNGKQIVVACAVGHLFTLSQTTPGSGVPQFDIKWVPNFLVRKGDFSKKYYDVLLKLAKNAGSVTVATDYDIEGEVIGLNVVRFIAGQPDAYRMKFSTLTEKELNESYEQKSKTINWGQALAGETRHFLDWFYGINLSRALMNALKSIGKFKIMSIGRVQGPALGIIVKKEKEILAFKPQPYWQIFITLENPKIELIHNKDIFKKQDLDKFKELKGKIADVDTQKKTQTLEPNPPFNLTTLQTESYRLFGFNPARTLQIAQSLYLAGLISYPRTSSQKLPPSLGYMDILEKLAKRYHAEDLIKRKFPVEGKKSDPAHPSIYPTGNYAEMNEDERKVYDLIVKRFLSLFCEDATIENKTITAKINGLNFIKKGAAIQNPGWLSIYPVKVVETEIPDVNGKIKIIDLKTVEKETQPPRRYSPASLVSELEKRNLGTKATRASIIETLYDRGYIEGQQSIKASPLGISLIDTLEKHSPIIIDEQLTRHFEKEMDQILQAKKGQLEREKKIIDEAKTAITKIAEQFKSQEVKIGEELSDATARLREQQKEESKLTPCPLCKKGELAIRYSPKTKRSFVGCTNYPECKNIYSLPPNSLIKKTDKTCPSCNFPMLLSLRKGKKPWFFCFNKDCETNKERLDAYRKKMAEENSGNSAEQ